MKTLTIIAALTIFSLVALSQDTLYITNTTHKYCREGTIVALIITATNTNRELVQIWVFSKPQQMKMGDKIIVYKDKIVYKDDEFNIMRTPCRSN